MHEAAESVEKTADGVEIEIESSDGESDEGQEASVSESNADAEAKPEAKQADELAERRAAYQADQDLAALKQELEEALSKSKAEADALKNRWLRAAADLENYKKRAVRERDEAKKFANESLLKDFLPVLDDIDRTLEVVSQADNEAVATLVDGVKLVQKKFLNQLEKHGVTVIETKGVAFDPNEHEAVQQMHSDDVPAGGVAMEVRRGYFLSGRLLRAAMVAVSLGPESKPEEEAASEPESAPEASNEEAEKKEV